MLTSEIVPAGAISALHTRAYAYVYAQDLQRKGTVHHEKIQEI